MIRFCTATNGNTTKTFKNQPPTRSRFNIFKFLSAFALVMLLGVNGVMGQTNPAAFALSGGSFTFTTQTATNTAYPTNMQGWNNGGTDNLATLSTAASTGNITMTASATASTAGLGNRGANGFQFLTTGSVKTVGAIAIALNTTGRSSILVTWTAADQTNAYGRQTNLTLQYRVGTSGTFTTVSGSTYTTNTGGVAGTQAASTFTNIALPSACDDQSVVQIRWLYYESASQSGSRDAITLDDITVSSSASATPSIAISNGTIAAGSPNNGQTNVVLQRYDMAVTSANANLTGLTVTTAGTYVAADLTNLKCWHQSSSTFNSGTATLLSTKTTSLSPGSQVFPTFTSQAITSGNTGYIFVTADIASGATNGNTINIASNAFSNISFSSGTKTGTDPVAAGGLQTITVPVPDIALSSPAASSANITVGTSNNVVYRFDLAITTATPSLTGVTISTSTGSNVSGDLTNLKCWYQNASTFNAGTATLLSTKTTSLAAGTQVFPSFSSQSLTTGSTYYIFITADVPLTATPNNTIIVSAITTSDLTFATGNKTGTANASGTKTIIDCTPTDVTSAAASSASSSSVLTWVNPACYDEILIVAALASNTGTPTGNGSAYTGNLAYGSGTALGNGFVVYKGSTSSQTVTGLTDGTQYFFKYFTRRGNTWTSGTEVDATPNVAGYYWNGASIAANPAAGGTGTWGTTNAWRQPSAAGSQATWANGNTAVFAGTAGTVTLPSSASFTSKNIQTSGYVYKGASELTGNIIQNTGVTSTYLDAAVTTNTTFTLNGDFSGGTAINLGAGATGTNISRLNLGNNASSTNYSWSTPITITGTGFACIGTGGTGNNATSSYSGNISGNGSRLNLGATSGNIVTFSGIVNNGSGDVRIAMGSSGGGGTIIFSNANNSWGATSFNAGSGCVVKLGIANALPTGTNVTMANSSNNGGIFDLNGFNQTIGSLTSGTGVGSITNNGATDATLTISGSTSPAEFGLVIADGTTNKTLLTRAGTGTLTLSNANTYSGATTVSAGTLQLAGGNVVSVGSITSSPIGKSTLNLNGGTLSSNSTTARTVLNATSIGGNIILGDATNTGALTFSAATTISGATRTLTTASAVTFAGAIGDGGNAYGVTKAGAGTLTLSGANSYTGATTLSAGTLQLAGGNVGSVGSITSSPIGISTLNLNGGTLSSNDNTARTVLNATSIGGDITLGDATNTGALTFSAATTISGATRTLTTASAVTFAGAIGDGGNAYGITKAGASTLTLSGANTYTGTTTISAGTINVTGITGIISTSFTSSAQSVTFSSATPTNGDYQLFNGPVSVSTSSFSSTNTPNKVVTFNYTTGVVSVSDPVTLTTSNTSGGTLDQIGTQNIIRATSNVVSRTILTVANGTGTLSSFVFTTPTTCNYTLNDIGAFKLYYSTSANGTTFASSSPSLLGSVTSIKNGAGITETITFSGLSQSLAAGTYYLWVTADVKVGATASNTLIVGAPTITASVGTATNGVSAIGTGTQTIIAAAITNYYLTGNNGSSASNYNTVADGSGSALTSLTNTDVNLIIDDETAVTLTGDLALGNNSKFIVSQGTTAKLTINGCTITGTIDVGTAGTLELLQNNSQLTNLSLGTLSAGSSILYNETAIQTIKIANYSNLTIGGGFTKTLAGAAAVSGTLTINGTVLALGSNNISAANLTLDGLGTRSGTWGSTASSATYKNDTYFSGSGVLTVTNNTALTPTITGVTASQSITYGAASVSLSGTVASGSNYPANGETVSVTINGTAQTTTTTGGNGSFAITYTTNAIPYSATPYTITYAYAGNGHLNAADNGTSTLTISKAALTVTADNKNKAYDGAIYSSGYTSSITGFVNSETESVISGAATYSGTAISATNAGTYTITPAVGTLAASNYTFSFSNGTLTINIATPTLSISNSPQTYTGSAIAAIVTASVAGTVTNVKYGGSSTVPTNAGTYAVTANLVPTDGSNYYSLTDVSAGNFVISPKALTITATNQTKCEGSTLVFNGTEFTLSGLVTPQDAVTSVTLTSDGAASNAAATTHNITPSSAIGTGLNNYNITYNNGTFTVNATGTWISGTPGNWSSSVNWCGGAPTSSSSITIPSGVTVTMDETTPVTVVSLTINGTLILPSTADLTVSGNIVNNGNLTIASGGSLVQTGSTANSGTGTYVAEREMSGAGDSTPNGRFWYMGVPMSGTTSTTLAAAGENKLWSHSETSGLYSEITTNGVSLSQGVGYVFRGGASGTYSFSSSSIGNRDFEYTLTRSSGSSKPGFNLISNPYPSHLSWDQLWNSLPDETQSSVLPTAWYRTVSGTTMLFDTYNAELAVGTSNNGLAVTGTIAPFQSFWVRLNEGTSLTMTATNAMRSHGTQSFLTLTPATVRLNISNGTLSDETIVVLKDDLSNDYDYRDSGKEIPSTTIHQLYSLEGSTRVAINGIANALAKDSLKLGVQIPTAGTYSINCTELTFSDMVFLEDKLTGSYLEVNSTTNYSFTSVAGTFNNRFVLHFAPYVPALPGQTAATAIAIPTSNWPQCNNVSTEDQWHAFTATSEAVSIAVNTTTTDIVIELQDGTGNVVAQENAVNGIGNETLNFFGLTAGQTYKVAVRNNISSQPTGTYGICVKSLKRGGCDYGAGPYSLCQYYKATWAGSTGVSYTFTFTGTSGPAQGQTFTRTQNSDICVLSTVTPLLPYGSTYNVVISNTYTLTDGAGNTEQVTVPSTSGCQVVTIAQPQTTLSASSSCNNGARFRGAVVSSMPWVCGANNWRWRFTEVNPLTMQTVGLPIELNRGAASNYLSLGSVTQLQNGKTYAVQTSPLFVHTGTNYQWGPVQYMCIVGAAQGALQDAEQGVAQGSTKDAMQGPSEGVSQENDVLVYTTAGNQIKVWTNVDNAELINATVRIYNSTGSLVYTQRMSSNEMIIDLNAAAGLYIVEVGGVKRKVVISPLVPG